MVCFRSLVFVSTIALGAFAAAAPAVDAVPVALTERNEAAKCPAHCRHHKKNSMNAKTVVANIEVITNKSLALQDPANSISLVNGPLIIIGQGPFPEIISGFIDIVATATTDIANMKGMSPITHPAGSEAIFDAFRDFVKVHQDLLNILIGKAGLFQTVPFIGSPVAAALRQVEGVVDTVALGLINAVQTEAQKLQAQASMLDDTLNTAISSYEGLQTSCTGLCITKALDKALHGMVHVK